MTIILGFLDMNAHGGGRQSSFTTPSLWCCPAFPRNKSDFRANDAVIASYNSFAKRRNRDLVSSIRERTVPGIVPPFSAIGDSLLIRRPPLKLLLDKRPLWTMPFDAGQNRKKGKKEERKEGRKQSVGGSSGGSRIRLTSRNQSE